MTNFILIFIFNKLETSGRPTKLIRTVWREPGCQFIKNVHNPGLRLKRTELCLGQAPRLPPSRQVSSLIYHTMVMPDRTRFRWEQNESLTVLKTGDDIITHASSEHPDIEWRTSLYPMHPASHFFNSLISCITSITCTLPK